MRKPPLLSSVLLLMLAGTFVWLVNSRHPQISPSRIHPAQNSNALGATPARPTSRPAPVPPERGAVEAAHPAAPARTSLGSPKPTIPTLAVAAQPPAGPVLGPGLTPTAVLQNM